MFLYLLYKLCHVGHKTSPSIYNGHQWGSSGATPTGPHQKQETVRQPNVSRAVLLQHPPANVNIFQSHCTAKCLISPDCPMNCLLHPTNPKRLTRKEVNKPFYQLCSAESANIQKYYLLCNHMEKQLSLQYIGQQGACQVEAMRL